MLYVVVHTKDDDMTMAYFAAKDGTIYEVSRSAGKEFDTLGSPL